jgi:hypothetical protein
MVRGKPLNATNKNKLMRMNIEGQTASHTDDPKLKSKLGADV